MHTCLPLLENLYTIKHKSTRVLEPALLKADGKQEVLL